MFCMIADISECSEVSLNGIWQKLLGLKLCIDWLNILLFFLLCYLHYAPTYYAIYFY